MKIFMITITVKNIPGEWREISGIVYNLNPAYLYTYFRCEASVKKSWTLINGDNPRRAATSRWGGKVIVEKILD